MELKARLTEEGASLVGFADLSTLSAGIRGSQKFAISMAVALDALIISEISEGPTKDYYQEYQRVNEFLSQLCKSAVNELKKHSNNAVAIEPTVEELDYETLATELPHKTVATRAGLGWIGKSALLVTEKFGPAIRLATVLTDAEFEVGKSVNSSRCGDCEECVVCCPGKAISGKNWELRAERGLIYNAFACCDTATKLSRKIGIPSTICGVCISVCPWARKYISRELAG